MRIVSEAFKLLIDAINAIYAGIQLYKLIKETGRNKKSDRSSRSDRADS